MRNKLIAACIAVIALGAFPAMASAIYLGETSGTALSTGAKIVATNEGNLKFTGAFGSVECTKSTLTGELKTNAIGGAVTEGNITSASFTGGGTTEAECFSTFLSNPTVSIENLPWCLRSTAKGGDVAELVGGSCGSPKNLRFTLTGTNGLKCIYEAASVTSLAFATPASTIKFESAPFTAVSGSSFGCTNGHFTGAYNLETDGNTTTVGIYSN